jgi:hypothetical protein
MSSIPNVWRDAETAVEPPRSRLRSTDNASNALAPVRVKVRKALDESWRGSGVAPIKVDRLEA